MADEEACCGPHVFTSVLLGVLACVLMTGGVFLAFHRWDPLWLIVSAVGVVLVLIGSVLHCCRTTTRRSKSGCCLPEHLHNHVVLNGGSLTEQLLPLSNARSVSQLSLNMLPGYFPPVVTTYGIEQHSTVVQNINRIIQQQTGQPVTQDSSAKNYILLSLPTNTPPAKIQNLVANVYQLDGSVLTDASTAADVPVVSDTTINSNPSVQSPSLKDAEVQTCVAWPLPISVASPSHSNANVSTEAITAPMSTQTDAIEITIDLMECLPLCDTAVEAAVINVPSNTNSSSSLLIDVSTEVPINDVSTEVPSSNVSTEVPIIDVSNEVPICDVSTEEPTIDNPLSVDVCTESSTNVECAGTPNGSSNDLTDSLLDGESLLDRSSPPPRYEDVALEGENSAFGLAYGTL